MSLKSRTVLLSCIFVFFSLSLFSFLFLLTSRLNRHLRQAREERLESAVRLTEEAMLSFKKQLKKKGEQILSSPGLSLDILQAKKKGGAYQRRLIEKAVRLKKLLFLDRLRIYTPQGEILADAFEPGRSGLKIKLNDKDSFQWKLNQGIVFYKIFFIRKGQSFAELEIGEQLQGFLNGVEAMGDIQIDWKHTQEKQRGNELSVRPVSLGIFFAPHRNLWVHFKNPSILRLPSSLYRWIFFFSVSGFFLSLLILSFILQSAMKPTRILSRAAQKIAMGDFQEPLPIETVSKEFRPLFETFEAMRRGLKEQRKSMARAERLSAWQDIARKVAHEIKNSLTPIQIAIQALERRERGKGDRLRGILEPVQGEINKLKSLVDEFTRFARLPSPRFELLELRKIIEESSALLRLKASNVKYTIEPPNSSWKIFADKEQISMVWNNLFRNALDAIGDEKGFIKIKLRSVQEWVEAEMEDSGKGISPSDLEKIFDPYFTKKSEGTGLGLAITSKIIEQHGGSIRAESEGEGKGAKFVLRFTKKS